MLFLITGGFGFVGGRLAQHLQQAGHEVILGTRKKCSSPKWLPGTSVAQIHWDDIDALVQLCDGVDVVIHAAGMNAQDCAADPVAALEVNGVATARMLAAAICADVQRFVYFSTAHVYASPLSGTITEELCPRNIHPYATSHLAGENSVLEASNSGKIEGIVVRLSNAFGAPMHRDVNCWMLLVNDLCKQVVETNKMLLNSSGLQQRDFITMQRVCQTVEHLVLCDVEKLQSRIFNLGSGVSQSVLQMAQRIQERCNVILGVNPQLLTGKSVVGECHEPVIYQSDNLTRMGIDNSQDAEVEIDSLLRFCSAAFSLRNIN